MNHPSTFTESDYDTIGHRFKTGVTDPLDIYYASKEIDGLSPAPSGTYPLWGLRVAKFYRLHPRQFFYEPVSNYQLLLEVSRNNHYINEGGAPMYARVGEIIVVEVFESSNNPPLGYLPMPRPGEKSRGLHGMALTGGWKDLGECLQLRNSWGRKWGEEGYGWLSRSYAERYMTEAWLTQNVRFGPTFYKLKRIEDAQDAKAVKRIWMVENPRWRMRFKFNLSGHQIVLFDAYSMESNCPVDIIEIRNGNGFRICWAHLFHLTGGKPRVSVLKEFFVWPWFQRQGYGRKLEELACERARMWGSEKIQVYFHQADTATTPHKVAGYYFSKSCGYSKRYKISKLPNLTAIGEKSLSSG